VDIYIINIDGVRTIEKELATRDDIDLIVVDELAMARNSSTERWKTLNVICNKQGSRRVWGMTGSPTPNSPVDAWAQCKLVTPDSTLVPKYFGRFRDSVMRQLTQFKWVPRPDANDTIHKMMQPAIRYSLDDCTDLPEQTFVTREVEMTKDQAKAYKDMFSKLSVELAGGQILAVNEAVKANKLIQIACIAYNTDVLTDAGWVPIQNVTASHKVWDGVAWVAQGGVVFRGVKPTITLDGVRMTPDHKVWVGEWVEAKDVLYANDDGRFDRPEVRLPNSYAEGGGVKIEMRDVGMPVRLRECGGACESVPENEAPYRSEKLRLLPREHNPRHDQHGAVQHLGKNETAVHEPQLQRLPSVRWARHNAVRAVAEIRKIFHRYGDWVQKQLDAGPHRQQRAVLAGELPVGYVKRAVKQQTVKQANTDAVGGNDRRTSGSRLWGKEVDAGSPIGPVWLERGEGAEPVYDLINCGPRSRFVVRGAAGQLLVVHNCGVAYDTTGNEVLIDNKPRIDAVKELIEESEGKVIVFVPLTGALEYVAKELATVYEDDDEVAIVHGETSKSARDEIFRSFQQSHSPRVLVANAQTMSHGLTLTAATTIIWYAPVHSNEIYEQACARVRRPGQTRTTVIAHVAGTDVERKIYKRLREKQSMQGVLLEMMKERNDD
jgi:hypothetical protein